MRRAPFLFSWLPGFLIARPWLACLLVAGCFEIPPELPGSDAASGAPAPIAVYDRDPFAAKNRWFERAFTLVDSQEGPGGRPSSGAAEPLPRADELELVDRAELIALTEAALREELDWNREPGRGCGEQRAAFVFRCDALALRAALGGRNGQSGSRLDGDLVRALDRFSREIAAPGRPLSGIDLNCFARPLPITGIDWKPVWTDLPGGLLPAAKDLRWTMVFRRETAGGRRESALLRHGVLRDMGGEPVLFRYLASECWILERAGEDVKATVWRFDRAASMADEEPWRELAPGEEFSIRDPLVANGEWLTGDTESLCLGCHGAGVARPPAAVFSSTQEAQLTRVREVLGEVESGAGRPE